MSSMAENWRQKLEHDDDDSFVLEELREQDDHGVTWYTGNEKNYFVFADGSILEERELRVFDGLEANELKLKLEVDETLERIEQNDAYSDFLRR